MSGTDRSFPALGYDPTPGNGDHVYALLLEMSSTLQVVGTAGQRLDEAVKVTGDTDWGGDAAEEYSDHGDDLVAGVAAAAEALDTVISALSTWAGQLAENQLRADELERQARRLKGDLAAARQAADTADGQAAVDAAMRVHARTAELDQVLAAAEDLRDKHQEQAEAAAEKIRDRADGVLAVDNDDWWDHALKAAAVTTDWVSIITGAAAAACAVTGIGAPVALALGTVSAASGATNLAMQLTMKAVDTKGAPGWTSLAVDTVSSITPVGRTVSAGIGQATRVATRRNVDGVVTALRDDISDAFRTHGVPGMLRDVKDMRLDGLSETAQRRLRDTGIERARQIGHDPNTLSDADLMRLGVQQGRMDALVAMSEKTEEGFEAAGVEMPDTLRNTLDTIQFLGTPPNDQLGDLAEERLANRVKEED